MRNGDDPVHRLPLIFPDLSFFQKRVYGGSIGVSETLTAPVAKRNSLKLAQRRAALDDLRPRSHQYQKQNHEKYQQHSRSPTWKSIEFTWSDPFFTAATASLGCVLVVLLVTTEISTRVGDHRLVLFLLARRAAVLEPTSIGVRVCTSTVRATALVITVDLSGAGWLHCGHHLCSFFPRLQRLLLLLIAFPFTLFGGASRNTAGNCC